MRRIVTAREQADMLAPWRMAATPGYSSVYHLTSTPNFSPDPEKRPEEGLHWSKDPDTTPKGLYVTTTPNYWLSWGNRPYAAHFEVPDELLKKFPPTRNYPEHLIPPEHYGDLKLKSVLPTPAMLRGTGYSDPEWAMGQDFLTGEKFKTRRTPNGHLFDEDRDAIKALWKKNYGDGKYVHPSDARDMSPQQQKKYEKWYTNYWNTSWKEEDDY